MDQCEPEELPAAAAVRLLIKFIGKVDHPEVERETVQGEGPAGDLQQWGGGADCYESQGVSEGHPATEVRISD